jgi:hypothetical protein
MRKIYGNTKNLTRISIFVSRMNEDPKIPVSQALYPSRVCLIEESNSNSTEEITISQHALQFGLESHLIVSMIKAVLVIRSIFGNANSSGSSMQNISRVMVKSDMKPLNIILVLFVSASSLPWIRERTRFSRFSFLTSEKFQSILNLVSLLIFISGLRKDYPITNQIHQIPRSCPPLVAEPAVQRVHSFELLTRTMTMESLSTLALLLVPYFNIKGWLHDLSRRIFPTETFSLNNSSCAKCRSSAVVMPHTAIPCGHIHCYYCSKCVTKCFRCDSQITSFSPFIDS